MFVLLDYCATATEVVCGEKPVENVPSLRCELTDSKFVSRFKENWVDTKDTEIERVELLREPFKLCVVKDFLQDADFLLKIREEFNEIEWNQRSLDLYEFHQSKDLQHLELPYLKLLYEFLKNDVMKWVLCYGCYCLILCNLKFFAGIRCNRARTHTYFSNVQFIFRYRLSFGSR